MKDEGHDDVVADGLHVEGNEVAGQVFVVEGAVVVVVAIIVFSASVVVSSISVVVFVMLVGESDFVEGGVEDIDAAFGEVGGVEIAIAVDGGGGKAGVAGAVGSFEDDCGLLRWRRAAPP